MSEESDDEKTEQPTPRRLEKAKEDGQVPRSRELTTLLLLASGLGAMWLTSGLITDSMLGVMRTSMAFNPAIATNTTRMMAQFWSQARTAIVGMAPFFVALFVISGVAPTLLGGLLISSKSLKVDPKRMNPVKGLKKMFSTKVLAEFAKAVAKSGLTGVIGALYIYTHLHQILQLASAGGIGAVVQALRMIMACTALVVLGFILVVLIDVPYQLWNHHKELRMSRYDIKKEQKETEGDPEIQQRIKQQQREMAQKRMMSEVPDADVIITNPTHYAVALAYKDDRMAAPRVVAKGAGEIAARIRELGLESHVPRLEAPPLARALYTHAQLDRDIPAALYTAVAEVLAWVYQLRRYRREGGDVPLAPSAIDVPAGMDEAGALS